MIVPRMSGQQSPSPAPGRAHEPPWAPDLQDHLERWQHRGLISAAEATAIAEFERLDDGSTQTEMGRAEVRDSARRRVPLVAEALGYLGGALAIAGLILLVSPTWDEMHSAVRLALTGVASVVFVVAGSMIRADADADPAMVRLRWVTWTVSTALAGGFAAVVTHDALGVDDRRIITAATAATVAAHAGALWRGRPLPLQQVTCLAAIAVSVANLISYLSAEWLAGIAVWVLGVTIGVLGVTRRLPLALLSMVVAAVMVMAGALAVAADRETLLPFAVASAVGTGAVAVVPRIGPAGTGLAATERVVLVVLSGVALWMTAPGAIAYFAERAGVATGLVTWGAGVLLLVAAAQPPIALRAVVAVLGGVAVVGGAALCGVQSVAAATSVGLVTALVLVGLGIRPGWSLMSVFGAAGLLVNVPWAIAHFLPGEDRAPLLIVVSGALLIALAVLLARQGGRLRRELGARG